MNNGIPRLLKSINEKEREEMKLCYTSNLVFGEDAESDKTSWNEGTATSVSGESNNVGQQHWHEDSGQDKRSGAWITKKSIDKSAWKSG